MQILEGKTGDSWGNGREELETVSRETMATNGAAHRAAAHRLTGFNRPPSQPSLFLTLLPCFLFLAAYSPCFSLLVALLPHNWSTKDLYLLSPFKFYCSLLSPTWSLLPTIRVSLYSVQLPAPSCFAWTESLVMILETFTKRQNLNDWGVFIGRAGKFFIWGNINGQLTAEASTPSPNLSFNHHHLLALRMTLGIF